MQQKYHPTRGIPLLSAGIETPRYRLGTLLASAPRLLENLLTLVNNRAATDAIKLPML